MEVSGPKAVATANASPMYDVACFFYSVTRKKHMSWVSVRGNRKISARVGKEWFYFFA